MNVTPTPFDISRNKDLLRLAQEVQDTKKPRILKREDEPVAAVVPLEVYEQWEKDQQETFADLFAIMDEAADNAQLSEEEAAIVANQAVNAVRAKRAEEKFKS